MRSHKLIGFVLFALIFSTVAIAQPYTLDKEIVPFRLELTEDSKMEGAMSAAANGTLTDKIQYIFVKGCNAFQFVDVYIFSNFGDPDFTAELSRNTWGDIESTQSTGSSKNGIINFKLRAEGDFGFKLLPTGKLINYTVIVFASPEIKEYMGSAFKSMDAEDSENNSEAASSNGGSSNTTLYILLGVALLVIGFLAARLLGRKKAAVVLAIIGLSSFQPIFAQPGFGDTMGVEVVDMDDIRSARYEERLRELGRDIFDGAGDAIDEGLDRLGEVGEAIEEDERYRTVRDLYDSYVGLGDCISSVPPPGMPRIPSFCTTDDCGSCFLAAREEFNEVRYTFERLRLIYSCTKTFTDRAIAFGDNVSGVHGVSGLAWQSEKRKIEKSVKDLQKAYDDKYVELLDQMKQALMALNQCEAEHGIEDWYDRFGYMYYEFTAMNYRRGD